MKEHALSVKHPVLSHFMLVFKAPRVRAVILLHERSFEKFNFPVWIYKSAVPKKRKRN